MRARKVYESFERSGNVKSSMNIGLTKKIKEIMSEDWEEDDYTINPDGTVSILNNGWSIIKGADDPNSEFYTPEWFRLRKINGPLMIDESFYKFENGKAILNIDQRLLPIELDPNEKVIMDYDDFINQMELELDGKFGMWMTPKMKEDFIKDYRSNPDWEWRVIKGDEGGHIDNPSYADQIDHLSNSGWEVFDVNDDFGITEALIYHEG